MKWILVIAALGALLVGCSRRPSITQPADGATYTLGSFSCIQVLLENNDYSDTTIEFHGWEPLSPAITCQNANNGPAQCCQPYGQGGGYAQGCGQQPCTVSVVVKRGDQEDVRFIKIGTQSQTPAQ